MTPFEPRGTILQSPIKLAALVLGTALVFTIPARASAPPDTRDYCPTKLYRVDVGTDGPDAFTLTQPSGDRWPRILGKAELGQRESPRPPQP